MSTYLCTHSYGSKGGAVIQSTLYRLFNPTTTTSDAILPLRFTAFAAYILVPFVGTLLIADDVGCSAEEAYAIMRASGPTGGGLHPLEDNDDELEDIMERNAILARWEKAWVSTLVLHISRLTSLHTSR